MPTDAKDGRLSDIAYATLAGVQRASIALLPGLKKSGGVGRAASASGTKLGQSVGDTRSDDAAFKRKSIAAVSPAA